MANPVPTTYEGPVCNLNNKVNLQQPTAQSLPQIPVATDAASTTAATNVIRQIIMDMLGDLPIGNNISENGGTPSTGSSNAGNFVEVPGTRQTSTKRIYNPDDNSQYVDITQITGLTFKDAAGNTLVFKQ